MNEFLKVLLEIGIFLIIAQTILHFRPRKEYEKYMKTIISLMVLSQLVVPVFAMLDKDYEIKLEEAVEKYQRELQRFEEEQLSEQLAGNRQATMELDAFEIQLKKEIEKTLGEEPFDVVEMDIIYEGEEQKIALYLKEKGNIAIETIAVGEQIYSLDERDREQIETLKEKVAKAVGVETEYLEIYFD